MSTKVDQRVREIVAESMGLDAQQSTVEDSMNLSDLGDSLDLIELDMILEEEFNIELNDEEVNELKTVGDLIRCVEGKVL